MGSSRNSTGSDRVVTSGRVGVVLGATALVVALGVPSQAARMINGKDLRNNSVTGQKIRDNTVTGKDVKESTLRGLLRLGDVAAFGAVERTPIVHFTEKGFTALAAVTFTAPRDGFLYLTGTVCAQDDRTLDGQGSLNYRLRVDGRGVTSYDPGHMLTYAREGSAECGAMTAVVPIKTGEHRAQLDGHERGDGSSVMDREISVLFVPSGSGYVRPPNPREPAPEH